MGAAIKKVDSKKRDNNKDGKLVEMQMYFRFKKYCQRNAKLKISELSIPEFYSYIKVDIEVMERKSGMKFPPNLMSEFKIG